MEIAVCLKRAPDTAEADVKVDATGKDIVRDKLAFTINEADNYALEEALLAKEKHNANVPLVSGGAKESEEVLRMGLAKGATAATRIDSANLGETTASVCSYGRVVSRQTSTYLTGCIGRTTGTRRSAGLGNCWAAAAPRYEARHPGGRLR